MAWQCILNDRKKRKHLNSVTMYCEKLEKLYAKNPPVRPKNPQKFSMMKRLKVPNPTEYQRRPLISNIVPAYFPISMLPISGENGVKQYYNLTNVNNYNTDINVNHQSETKPKWTGIEDILTAYQEYTKGNF